jgi:hypothetical protein
VVKLINLLAAQFSPVWWRWAARIVGNKATKGHIGVVADTFLKRSIMQKINTYSAQDAYYDFDLKRG